MNQTGTGKNATLFVSQISFYLKFIKQKNLLILNLTVTEIILHFILTEF